MKVNIFFLLFISLIFVSRTFACNDNIEIQITAKQFANNDIRISSPIFNESLLLDSNGYGSIKIPLEIKTFAFISFSSEKINIQRLIFLNKKNKLSVNISDGNFSFKGDGSDINQLILSCDNYLQTFSSEIKAQINLGGPTKEIVSLFNKNDKEFNLFFDSQIKKMSLSAEISNLLRNNFLAKIYGEKQQYLTLLTDKEIDSLNLVKVLGISPNSLFKDSVLIESGSAEIKNFLTWNFQFRVIRSLSFEVLGPKKYLFAVEDYIYSDTSYSHQNKEYLMFDNISTMLFHFGVNKEIDLLIQNYYSKFPETNYRKQITDLYNRFDNLGNGKPAPKFTLHSMDGKVYGLDDFRGKTVFIDVWATWCLPCLRAMPKILEMQTKYSDIVFLFTSIDEDLNKWQEFLASHEERKGLDLNTRGTEFLDLYRITGVPRYILIDKDGNIINSFLSGDINTLQQELEKNSN